MRNKIDIGSNHFLLRHYLLPFILSVALLALGIASTSVPLVIASGIVAFGWPFYYVYLLSAEEKTAEAAKAPVKQLPSTRPSAVGAR